MREPLVRKETRKLLDEEKNNRSMTRGGAFSAVSRVFVSWFVFH